MGKPKKPPFNPHPTPVQQRRIKWVASLKKYRVGGLPEKQIIKSSSLCDLEMRTITHQPIQYQFYQASLILRWGEEEEVMGSKWRRRVQLAMQANPGNYQNKQRHIYFLGLHLLYPTASLATHRMQPLIWRDISTKKQHSGFVPYFLQDQPIRISYPERTHMCTISAYDG